MDTIEHLMRLAAICRNQARDAKDSIAAANLLQIARRYEDEASGLRASHPSATRQPSQ
jgi:hypothetical protein